ncbi:MAG: sigma-70 family RNA polymerase sigma factor [Lachnospiraceae bacterium]|jgi:RNA polymerase sigma-70 factor (ECF subfamily)|nr:sigma-70 family RNA polymerase sigma factor [Lachnospiraceae bacterium]
MSERVEAALRDYADMVYKIALSQTKNKDDAEDIFQNVFLSLVRNKKEIATDEHMKAWLIRVTVNHCKKLFRAAERQRTTELTEDMAIFTPAEQDVLTEVLELPPLYRTAIHLFYYEDMTVDGIAAALEVKPATVKSRLHRGREMLREKLKGEYGFDEQHL